MLLISTGDSNFLSERQHASIVEDLFNLILCYSLLGGQPLLNIFLNCEVHLSSRYGHIPKRCLEYVEVLNTHIFILLHHLAETLRLQGVLFEEDNAFINGLKTLRVFFLGRSLDVGPSFIISLYAKVEIVTFNS